MLFWDLHRYLDEFPQFWEGVSGRSVGDVFFRTLRLSEQRAGKIQNSSCSFMFYVWFMISSSCNPSFAQTERMKKEITKTWGICTRIAGKLYKARSRLHRSRILQVNTRWEALGETYKIYTLLRRSAFKMSAKVPQFSSHFHNFSFKLN